MFESIKAISLRDQMRLAICAALAASIAAGAQADELYKWVDEDGNVTYQDQPPPGDNGQVETIDDGVGASAPAAAAPDVNVVLYSIEVCDACDLVRDLLRERGIPFEEKRADEDQEVRTELKEVSGVLSVPVLLIGEEVLHGYNRELILNELEEAGFSTSVKSAGEGEPVQGEETSGGNRQLTREELENMSPEEVQQAARDAVLRGEDNDLFDEDEGLATLNEDIFTGNSGSGTDDSDVTQWEEIPEDERIRVRQP